jgi:hypothetical protein
MLIVIMLSVCHFIYRYSECPYDEGHYAECHYAECRYAECCGAPCRPQLDIEK